MFFGKRIPDGAKLTVVEREVPLTRKPWQQYTKTGPYQQYISMSHNDPFQELMDAMRRVLTPQPPSSSFNTAAASTSTASTPSPVFTASPMAKPAPYSGSAEDCSGFLLQCELVLEMQPHIYSTDTAKIAFIISQLQGKALQWADSLWTQKGSIVKSYPAFVSHFREVFGKPLADSSIGEKLYNLKQGNRNVNDYALQFRTLAASSGWNEQALITTFCQGLEPNVRLHLAAYEDSEGLERFIQLAIRVGSRMQSCLLEHQGQPLTNTFLLVALLDSGSAGNFISGSLCRQLKLKTTPSPLIYQVHSITGKPLSRKMIRRCVGPLQLRVGILHTENIHLLVLEDSTADVVLGPPWLEQHSPTISWRTGEVLKWGDHCFSSCFPVLPVPRSPRSMNISINTTSIESPVEKRSVDIPSDYAPFSDTRQVPPRCNTHALNHQPTNHHHLHIIITAITTST
ncbi:Retrotransposon-like protein 1 [Anabarilius grahami]|uniref:Retrotransposon-like protein 1 n=1 Tax=Anabarilius grahami TaxID=495550 RepID=A0A3N0XSC7_ANAGA|nr:Retrotransposon-like protein 1 [Anabarilius grahami]